VSRPTNFFAAIPNLLALAACSLGQQTFQLIPRVPPAPGAGSRSTLVRDESHETRRRRDGRRYAFLRITNKYRP
jgi:hypothetical protein